MSPKERAIIAEIAAKLAQLRKEAEAAGQPFPAYLIAMAAVEAAKPGG